MGQGQLSIDQPIPEVWGICLPRRMIPFPNGSNRGVAIIEGVIVALLFPEGWFEGPFLDIILQELIRSRVVSIIKGLMFIPSIP